MEAAASLGVLPSDTSQESQSRLQTSEEEELSAEEGELSAFEDSEVAEASFWKRLSLCSGPALFGRCWATHASCLLDKL